MSLRGPDEAQAAPRWAGGAHLSTGSTPMAPTSPDPVDSLVAALVHRHRITGADAIGILCRAATRKGVSLEVLAHRVFHGSTPVVAG